MNLYGIVIQSLVHTHWLTSGASHQPTRGRLIAHHRRPSRAAVAMAASFAVSMVHIHLLWVKNIPVHSKMWFFSNNVAGANLLANEWGGIRLFSQSECGNYHLDDVSLVGDSGPFWRWPGKSLQKSYLHFLKFLATGVTPKGLVKSEWSRHRNHTGARDCRQGGVQPVGGTVRAHGLSTALKVHSK